MAAELMQRQDATPGTDAGPAREQWIAECVARVIARLQLRRHAELVLTLASLAREWSDDAPLGHARLRVTHTTAAFLRRLAAGTEEDAAMDVLRQAWRCGLIVTLELDPAEFGRLPVSGLARLPLRYCTADGMAVHLLARRVAGYADIAALSPGYLVLARAVLLTALARDEAAKRGLQLYRQE
ncbi:PduM family microcompartment protein [Sodalis ligni]|uniref:Microcompartment protein PduM n=1 Tax=Sodalis ligni TaxID=2697027 RepID=A0A4R1N607_9GAMM|nr:PduM family microcompartment protein [Sodalis ligni]QWA13736.1 PduM family microcompartment protein [Sodalis ligni]TCL02553.1 microcompartment protein PduM [Sodalis ligni]